MAGFFTKITGKGDYLNRAFLSGMDFSQVMERSVPAAVVDKYDLIVVIAAIESRDNGILKSSYVFRFVVAGNYQ